MSIDGGEDPHVLSEGELGRIVRAYGKLIDLSQTDDPADHFIRLLKLAHDLPGANLQAIPCRPLFDGAGRRENFVVWAASCLFAANPCIALDSWERLVGAILYEYCGHTKAYIKRSPTKLKLDDARRMTPKQLMEKHGISKTRAYQLLAQARAKR